MKTIVLAVIAPLFLLLSSAGDSTGLSPTFLALLGSPAPGQEGREVSGSYRTIIGSRGTGGEFFSPGRIEVDSQGDLYVVDSHGGRLRKVDGEGRTIWEIGGEEWGGEGFLVPGGVAVSSGLAVYLLDLGSRRVYRINGLGEIEGVVENEDLRDPRAIALTPTGKLVVYEASSREIIVLNPAGRVLWSFKPDGFRSKTHVEMSLRGEEEICLYTRGSKVLRFYHFMGGLNRIWRPVLPDGRRLEASSLDIDESGRVFILDGNVRVIYVFDRLGNLLLDMSGSMRDMRYKGPGDIRVAEGVVYLTEGRTGRVLALSLPRELRN